MKQYTLVHSLEICLLVKVGKVRPSWVSLPEPTEPIVCQNGSADPNRHVGRSLNKILSAEFFSAKCEMVSVQFEPKASKVQNFLTKTLKILTTSHFAKTSLK